MTLAAALEQWLDEAQGGRKMIPWVPMSGDAFQAYLAYAVPRNADETVPAGGAHPDEALASAEAQFQSLLPDGLSTPGQYLSTVEDVEPGANVG